MRIDIYYILIYYIYSLFKFTVQFLKVRKGKQRGALQYLEVNKLSKDVGVRDI